MILLNGLLFPIISSSFGLAYVIGRILYGYGYSNNGVDGRRIGAFVNIYKK